MIRIFSDKWRNIPESQRAVMFLQVSLDFRQYLHLFRGGSLAVFLAIALHANSEGEAWPSLDLLEKETGLARATIARALDYLCSLNINGQQVLLRYRKRDLKTKRFVGSNRYIIFPTEEQVRRYASAASQQPEFKNSTVQKLNCGEPEFKNSTVEKLNCKDKHLLTISKYEGSHVEEEVNLINSSATKNFSASTSASSTSLSPQKAQSAVPQNQTSPLSQGPESNNNGSKSRYSAPTGIDAEALYRKIRPTHVTIPSSINPLQAIEVLKRYLQLYQDLDAAANALRPFAQEADRRGIRETNLCWLTEWAAVGKIPPTTKNTGRYKREMSRPLNPTQPQTQKRGYDYETWPWEKKKFIAILDGYMRKVMSHQEFFKHSTDELIDMFFDIVAKKLPEGLEPGKTLRICFDDDNIVEGELEEIIYSTLHPEYITHLVVDGEAIDALQLVEAEEISYAP